MRVTVGVAMLTISLVPMLTIWASRADPWNLLRDLGFWVGIAVFLVSVFLLGSALPNFQAPKLKIVVGNDVRFHTHLHPRELHRELAGNIDPKRVDVRLTRIRVVEYGLKWADSVRVEVVTTDPLSNLREPVEFLHWYSKDNLDEWKDIPPGGSAWAILHTNVVNLDKLNESVHQGVVDRTESFKVILAVTSNGKIMDAVEIQVDGAFDLSSQSVETGFGQVLELNRPKIKAVDKINRKRLAQRL
jgi:hypothetical protein